jgi:hypothetical protein
LIWALEAAALNSHLPEFKTWGLADLMIRRRFTFGIVFLVAGVLFPNSGCQF